MAQYAQSVVPNYQNNITIIFKNKFSSFKTLRLRTKLVIYTLLYPNISNAGKEIVIISHTLRACMLIPDTRALIMIFLYAGTHFTIRMEL